MFIHTAVVAFWVSLLLVLYAYAGYALWLGVSASKRPIRKRPIKPTVSILIAARNEEANLLAKLDNLSELRYPRDCLEILIVSDGSTDATANILCSHGPTITPIIIQQSVGKAAALNIAVSQSLGEILVFLDVRQSVAPDVIGQLTACFADSDIGAVSGELLLESPVTGLAQDALGLYWKIEKLVRKLESESGSVVGVTGAIYAMRRNLYVNLPEGTILDDLLIPMNVVRQGKRVVFEASAVACDRIFTAPGKEFSRKIRTLTGNYQLLQLAPWLLSTKNPLLFRFISHKLLRLAVPFLLMIMLPASAVIGTPFYDSVCAFQLLLYAGALWGALQPSTRRIRLIGVAHTFVMLNTAAVIAFFHFITGRRKVWL